MARISGTIHLAATASGKTLRLTNPNPDPPPAVVTAAEWSDPPAWAWDLVKGNAGRPCTVDTDESNTITGVAVA